METLDKIKKQINENAILLYMKGSPKLPSCGFSSQAAQALMQCGYPFAYVDILQNPDILPGGTPYGENRHAFGPYLLSFTI